jgi:hypothetical protein
MKEHEAFLRQARSDYRTFRILWAMNRSEMPACHPLHYLQMACEKLAKAVMLAGEDSGFDRYSHATFSNLPTVLRRLNVASTLGYDDFRIFKKFLQRSKPIFHGIDELHPSIGPRQSGGGPPDGPNTEYPWKAPDGHGGNVWKAPVDHNFGVAKYLNSGDGAAVMVLIEGLLLRFKEIYR